MANYWALSAGLWNNISNWLTGTSPGNLAGALPNSLDYVYTNGRIITVNVTARVAAISNGSSQSSISGGHFHLNSGVTLSAFVLGGGANNQYTVQFLSASPHQATLVGNLCAVDNTIPFPGIIRHNGTGTLNVRGSLLPSRNNGVASTLGNAFIQNLSSGTLNLFGSYCGSNASGTLPGIVNSSSGTINILGSLSGLSTSTNANACMALNSSVVNVTGNIIGQLRQPGFTAGARGIWNANASSRVNIVGNVFENGAYNANATLVPFITGPGIMTVRGNCINGGACYGSSDFANLAPCILNQGTLTVIGNCFGSNTRRNTAAIINLGTTTAPTSAATINLYGNVIGGRGVGTLCIRLLGSNDGGINVYGDVVGGIGTTSWGILTESAGPVRVFGSSIGGPAAGAHGVYNLNNVGNVYVKKVVGNSWGTFSFVSEVPALSNLVIGDSVGLFNNAVSGMCYFGELACGIRGNWPVGGPGPIYLSGSKDTKVSIPTDNFGPRVTTVALCANSDFNPLQRHVRENVDFEIVNGVPLVEDPLNPGRSNKYGTLQMPDPSLVAIGAPTDDTVGTATFENPERIWDVLITDPGLTLWDTAFDNLPPGEELPINFRRNFNWTYGARVRNAVTLNALSAVIKSLNNQPR
jgi:hypothetical protein